MATRFGHVNLVARDWRALAAFYEDVFGCEPSVRSATSRATGWIAHADVAGEAHLEVVYARDPEGNIVELQRWG